MEHFTWHFFRSIVLSKSYIMGFSIAQLKLVILPFYPFLFFSFLIFFLRELVHYCRTLMQSDILGMYLTPVSVDIYQVPPLGSFLYFFFVFYLLSCGYLFFYSSRFFLLFYFFLWVTWFSGFFLLVFSPFNVSFLCFYVYFLWLIFFF